MDIRTVSGIMEHSQVSTTLDRYVEYLPDRGRKAMEVLSGALPQIPQGGEVA